MEREGPFVHQQDTGDERATSELDASECSTEDEPARQRDNKQGTAEHEPQTTRRTGHDLRKTGSTKMVVKEELCAGFRAVGQLGSRVQTALERGQVSNHASDTTMGGGYEIRFVPRGSVGDKKPEVVVRTAGKVAERNRTRFCQFGAATYSGSLGLEGGALVVTEPENTYNYHDEVLGHDQTFRNRRSLHKPHRRKNRTPSDGLRGELTAHGGSGGYDRLCSDDGGGK